MNATPEQQREVMKEITDLVRVIASLRLARGAECVVVVSLPIDDTDPASDHSMRICSTLPSNHTATILAEIAAEMVNEGIAVIDREAYIRDPETEVEGAVTP